MSDWLWGPHNLLWRSRVFPRGKVVGAHSIPLISPSATPPTCLHSRDTVSFTFTGNEYCSTLWLAWLHLFPCPIHQTPVNNNSVPLWGPQIPVPIKCSSLHSCHYQIPKIFPMSLSQLLASHSKFLTKPFPASLFTLKESSSTWPTAVCSPTIQATILPHSLTASNHRPLGSKARHSPYQNHLPPSCHTGHQSQAANIVTMIKSRTSATPRNLLAQTKPITITRFSNHNPAVCCMCRNGFKDQYHKPGPSGSLLKNHEIFIPQCQLTPKLI